MRGTVLSIVSIGLVLGAASVAPTVYNADRFGGNGSSASQTPSMGQSALYNAGAIAVAGKLLRNGGGQQGAVFLKVLPSYAVITKFGPGEPIPTLYAAYQSVDASGDFAMRLDPSKLPSDYIAQDGQVDVELTATDGTSDIVWSTSLAAPVAQGDSFTSTRAAGHAPVLQLDFARSTADDDSVNPSSLMGSEGTKIATADEFAAQKAIEVQRHSAAAFQIAETHVSSNSQTGPLSVAQPNEVCTSHWGNDPQNATERWGNIYGTLAPWSVTLSNGNSHTLGILTGSSQAGSESISSELSGSTTAAQATLYNTVQYRSYNNPCYLTTTKRPYSVQVLISSYARIGEYNYSNCTRVSANVPYTKSTSKNLTFSGGVKIAGVGLTAQSGWSNSVQMSVKPTQAGYVCGDSSAGWAASANVSNRR